MQLIDYTPEWFGPVTRLFYESVHRSGGAAYSPEELEAWAPREMDFSSWETSLVRQRCVLALDDRGELCGFGDIDAEGGYLDRLYVRSDCQRQGVAGAICDRLEQLALDTGSRTIRVDASRLARPFFLRRGYRVVTAQRVERRGVLIENFRMEKSFPELG
ncbi:MAG: GNAT family N-acetyltransferase [Clostridiales bacterium]|nr:GNAT family N-acetyltransferase [Clostridiales bacterium]